MQQAKLKSMCVRMWGVAALAACTHMAWAAPEGTDGPADALQAATVPKLTQEAHQEAHQDAHQDALQVAVQTDAALVPQAVAPAAPALAKAGDDLGFGQAADLGKLESSRGGTDTSNTTNNANLSGMVSGNSAVNVVTGNNVIDAGSFANMSGIPVVIQNTGANVLIQNSTILNLQMK